MFCRIEILFMKFAKWPRQMVDARVQVSIPGCLFVVQKKGLAHQVPRMLSQFAGARKSTPKWGCNWTFILGEYHNNGISACLQTQSCTSLGCARSRKREEGQIQWKWQMVIHGDFSLMSKPLSRFLVRQFLFILLDPGRHTFCAFRVGFILSFFFHSTEKYCQEFSVSFVCVIISLLDLKWLLKLCGMSKEFRLWVHSCGTFCVLCSI